MFDHEHCIAGFWRRIFACAIDSLLLAIVLYIFGFICLRWLAYIGPFFGRVIGLLLLLLYFGLLESRIGNGQTLGKKLLKIQVVSQKGQLLSISRSFLRSFLFWLPMFLNGLLLPNHLPSVFNTIYSVFAFVGIFGLGLAIIYFYLFNNISRQSAHDLLVGSYVVQKGCDEGAQFPKVWRGHFIIYGVLISLIAIAIAAGVFSLWHSKVVKEALKDRSSIELVYSKVMNLKDVSDAIVVTGIRQNMKAHKKYKVFSVNVLKKTPLAKTDLQKLANIVLTNVPNVDQYDYIFVKERYGFDLMLISSFMNLHLYKSPDQWRQQNN